MTEVLATVLKRTIGGETPFFLLWMLLGEDVMLGGTAAVLSPCRDMCEVVPRMQRRKMGNTRVLEGFVEPWTNSGNSEGLG